MNEERSTSYESRKIQSFTDLRTWQEGHRLVIEIYHLTKSFPKEELFGLVMQLRRASVSVTSNIAEGFGRANSKERAQFYAIALGSLTEVQNQLMIARDVEFLSHPDFATVFEQTVTVHKMLSSLMRKSRLPRTA